MAYEFSVGQFPQAEGLESALDGISKPVQGAAQLHLAALMRAFREGGHKARGGQQWAPWSKSYAAQQAKRGRTQILADTGILRSSLNVQVSEPAKGDVRAVIGSNVRYAAAHQYGVDKAVQRAAGTRIIKRKRGKWAVDKKGNKVWRKGSLLKRTILEESTGDVLRKFKVSGAYSQDYHPSSYVLTIPARPFVVMTDQDSQDFQYRLARNMDIMLNGKGGARGA